MNQYVIKVRFDSHERQPDRLERQPAKRPGKPDSNPDRLGIGLDWLIHVGLAWVSIAIIELMFDSPLIQITLGALALVYVAQLWSWRSSAN